LKVGIIDYGIGNIKSVANSLSALNIDFIISKNADELLKTDKVIFPGVGDASFGMSKLKENNLASFLKSTKKPVLGICLGMQLLCKQLEENNTQGLGVFNLNVKKYKNDLPTPQVGWNKLINFSSELFYDIPSNAYLYFVNSYFVEISTSYTIASSVYGQPFSAAIKKNNFYGTQFHPEKSGRVGKKILENFLSI
jgi:glutamine amidotransferase